VGVFRREEAQQLLLDGIQHGLVSRDAEAGFPHYVWMVYGERVIEARCDNRVAGTYHGYPLETDDPMADDVRNQWWRGQTP